MTPCSGSPARPRWPRRCARSARSAWATCGSAEAQRLRIASRLRSSQRGVLYVFDEPSTGLHPLDVGTLVGVFDRLLDAGATIIVIDHDLDLLATADYLIDMGPGGGADGGRLGAQGAPRDVARDPASVTAPWRAAQLGLPATAEQVAGR